MFVSKKEYEELLKEKEKYKLAYENEVKYNEQLNRTIKEKEREIHRFTQTEIGIIRAENKKLWTIVENIGSLDSERKKLIQWHHDNKCY